MVMQRGKQQDEAEVKGGAAAERTRPWGNSEAAKRRYPW